MDMCLEHLLQYEREGDEFLYCIVKGDKSWCLYYDQETKRTNQQWQHSSHPPPSNGKVKSMPTLFINHGGPLLIDRLPKGIIVNADCHSETLRVLGEHIKAKRPGMVMRVIILFHNTTRPKSARTSHEKLQQFQWKFFHIPATVQISPPVTTMLFGPMKKSKVSASLQMGCTGSNHNMVSLITTGLLVMWYKQTWWICGMPVSTTMQQNNMSSCWRAHTVRLFIKQPVYPTSIQKITVTVVVTGYSNHMCLLQWHWRFPEESTSYIIWQPL